MTLCSYKSRINFDEALARHAQYVRWMKAIPCTCISADNNQPDPRCRLCKGRGIQYVVPTSAYIHEEVVRCDFQGKFTTAFPCITGTAFVLRAETNTILNYTQVDATHFTLQGLFPKPYEYILVSYNASFVIEQTLDVCTILKTEEVSAGRHTYILRPEKSYVEKMTRVYEGTLVGTPIVYDAWNDDATVPVVRVERDLITITVDDETALDVPRFKATYSIVMPFRFLVHSISEKTRWNDGYVQEQADAIIVVPSYIKASINDLFTVLSAEQTAANVIEPREGEDTDIIANYFDISKLLSVRNSLGVEVSIANVSVLNRNELYWISGRPTSKYAVQFLFHPTFAAIPSLPTLRNADDNVYVNRVNVVEYVRMTSKATF